MGNEASQAVKYGDKLENDVSVSWEKLGSSAQFPGRDGHCACSVANKLYVFGGVVHPTNNSDDVKESNDLLSYDLDSKKWSCVEVSGDIPPPRSMATMSAVGTNLYLFGGLSRETGWFDTLHCFNTETLSWSVVTAEGSGPSPRDKLASAVVGEKVYVFGGFGPQGMQDVELEELSDEEEEDDEGAQFGWFNDLFIFNTATKTWSSPMQMNLGAPTPRAAHGMCAVGKHLVIFGGRDADARQCDLHIFDTETRKWQTSAVVHGRQPAPRSFHSVTAVGTRVVVYGGRGVSDQDLADLHVLDTEKLMWLEPAVTGTVPPGRGVHTATVTGDRLLVYGGAGAYSQDTLQCTQYYSDLYSVPTDDILRGFGRLPKEGDQSAAASDNGVAKPTVSSATEDTEQNSDQQSISESPSAKKPKLDVGNEES